MRHGLIVLVVAACGSNGVYNGNTGEPEPEGDRAPQRVEQTPPEAPDPPPRNYGIAPIAILPEIEEAVSWFGAKPDTLGWMVIDTARHTCTAALRCEGKATGVEECVRKEYDTVCKDKDCSQPAIGDMNSPEWAECMRTILIEDCEAKNQGTLHCELPPPRDKRKQRKKRKQRDKSK